MVLSRSATRYDYRSNWYGSLRGVGIKGVFRYPRSESDGYVTKEKLMSVYSIIGLVLMIWALPTLVFAIYRKDRGQIVRASRVTCIAVLILAMGYVGH